MHYKKLFYICRVIKTKQLKLTIMKLDDVVFARLKFHDAGNGVNYELWIDPITEIIYEIPLEINRSFCDAKIFTKPKPPTPVVNINFEK